MRHFANARVGVLVAPRVLTEAAALDLGLGLAEAPASSYAACQSDELGARITSAGSVASHPWSTIAFTNVVRRVGHLGRMKPE